MRAEKPPSYQGYSARRNVRERDADSKLRAKHRLAKHYSEANVRRCPRCESLLHSPASFFGNHGEALVA